VKQSAREKVFAAGPGARDRKKKLPIPNPLVGCWQGGGSRWTLTDKGVWSAIEGPHKWSVSADGQQLVWNGWTLKRTSGSGTTYVGVWGGTDTCSQIEISFKEDGNYQWRWVNENDTADGYYMVTGNMLTVFEKRADVTATATKIILDPVGGGTMTATYALNGDKLHMDFRGGDTLDYLNVTC
jgi:hypothetical protein